MLFSKKADEMEMSINFKAMRLAYVCENAALLIWLCVDLILTDTLSYTLLEIIMLQNVVFFASRRIMAHRMARDGDEE